MGLVAQGSTLRPSTCLFIVVPRHLRCVGHVRVVASITMTIGGTRILRSCHGGTGGGGVLLVVSGDLLLVSLFLVFAVRKSSACRW